MAEGEAQPHAGTVMAKHGKKRAPHGPSGLEQPDPAISVDAAQVRLVPNADGTLKLVTPAKTFKRVRIRLGRPLYEPDDFATVFADGGAPAGHWGGGKGWGGGRGHGHGRGGRLNFGTHEVALITNLTALSAEAKQILDDHRLHHDFTCKILKVNSLAHQFGAAFWEVETDKGMRQFVIRGTTEHVRWLDDDRLLITDVHGNRFEIPSLNGLDRRSQYQIHLIL